jgi:hypothetical protein
VWDSKDGARKGERVGVAENFTGNLSVTDPPIVPTRHTTPLFLYTVAMKLTLNKKTPVKIATFKRIKTLSKPTKSYMLGTISLSPAKIIENFGKPTSLLPDTFGEFIFLSSDKKTIFTIYDYKSKEVNKPSSNPWTKTRSQEFYFGGKKTSKTAVNIEAFVSFLASLSIKATVKTNF